MMINTVVTNKLSAPVQFTREEFVNVGALDFALGLSVQNFLTGTDFEIWDSATGGTQLVEGVDYELNYVNWRVANAAGYEVKCYAKILNATYQTGSIFITCKIANTETDGNMINYLYDETVDLRAEDINLQNQISAISGSLPFPEISGVEVANDGTDPNNDILFPTGFCYSSDFAYAMTLSSPLIKQLDATWAVGTNAGGLFSGTKAINTTYHMFLIRKDSDGSIDAGFDTSVTAANIPVGYTAYRRVTSLHTDSAGNWTQGFFSRKDKTWRLKTKSVVNNLNVSTTPTLYTFYVPTGIQVKIYGLFTGGLSTSGTYLAFNAYAPDETPTTLVQIPAAFTTFNGVIGVSNSTADAAILGSVYSLTGIQTDTSGQIYLVRAGSYFSATYYSTYQTHAWVDFDL